MTEVKVESTTPTTPDAPLLEEDKPRDLFEDMAPVIHATKKVYTLYNIVSIIIIVIIFIIQIMLKGPHNQKPTPNLNQFAVDPTFTGVSSSILYPAHMSHAHHMLIMCRSPPVNRHPQNYWSGLMKSRPGGGANKKTATYRNS